MSKKPAALFITLDGLSDPLGQSQVLPYLCGLSKEYQINIASCEKPKSFQKNSTVVKKIIADHEMNWEYTNYSSAIPLWSQYSNIQRLKKVALKLAKENDVLIYHCRSLIPAMIGDSLRKELGGKLLFDMRGFWADERVEGNIWSLTNPIFKKLYRYFKKHENRLIQTSESIITLTEKAKAYIHKEYSTDVMIDVIPCCVDTDKFSLPRNPKKKQELLKDLSIADNQMVLLYLGSLGTRYELKHMLQFFKELKYIRRDAILLFVTNTDPEFINRHCTDLGISPTSIRITAASSEEVPDYINLADASIYFIKTGFTGKAVSPTKQAESLIMEVPVVVNSGVGDTELFIKQYKIGVMVNDYENYSLRKAAEELMMRKFDKRELRKFASEHLSLQRAISTYSSVYQKLLA